MKTVLIVDDSMISRLMLKAIINHHYPEWMVLEAEDADRASVLAQSHAVDVVTLDLNMPGTDGLTLAPKLQAVLPNARIALLTSNMQERVQAAAEKQGLVFIAKPITEDKVLNFLAKARF